MPEPDLYSRQEMLAIRQFDCVAVVGCGGVGSWVAMFEAMIGTRKIYIADGDLLEFSNLNRLPFQARMVGARKTEVVSKWVAEHILGAREDCEVICLPRLDQDTLDILNDAEIVFDCTDRVEIQRVISSWCKEKKKEYYHAGYNGMHISITSDSSDVWGEGGGYTITPSFVAPTTMVASMVVYIAHTTPDGKINFSIDIDKIFQPPPEVKEEPIVLVPRRGGRKKVHQDNAEALRHEMEQVAQDVAQEQAPSTTQLAQDGLMPDGTPTGVEPAGLGALFDAPHVEADEWDVEDDDEDDESTHDDNDDEDTTA